MNSKPETSLSFAQFKSLPEGRRIVNLNTNVTYEIVCVKGSSAVVRVQGTRHVKTIKFHAHLAEVA